MLPVSRAVLFFAVASAACRSRPQDRFVALGRGAIDHVESVSVVAVATASTALNYHGENVEAGPGHKYVLLDCRFGVPPSKVGFDDFQLVRDSAAQIGQETNLGDNRDDAYFYWTYLDRAGRPIAQVPDSIVPFMARLAFKVPSDAQRGFLSYWGLYWGPLQFEEGGRQAARKGG